MQKYLKKLDGDLQRRKFVDIKRNGNYIHCQLDTASDITIIRENTCQKIGKLKLTHTKKVECGVSGKKLHFKGEIMCNVSFVGKTVKAKSLHVE